jgi:hypothetical protein
VIKTVAYRLLGGMIEALRQTDTLTGIADELNARCAMLAEHLIGGLRAELEPAVATVADGLPTEHRGVLRREHARWTDTKAWQLINITDPSGT